MKGAKGVFAAMLAVLLAMVAVYFAASHLHEHARAIPDQVLGAGAALAVAGIAFGLLRLFHGPFAQDRQGGGWQGSAAPRAKTPLDPAAAARIRQIKEESARAAAQYRERKRLRLAELNADPAKRAYVARVERGEEWSDAQIAYHENPLLAATCAHLQPIELAMRAAGVVPKMLEYPWQQDGVPLLKVRADCCINEAALRQRHPLPACVAFQQGYQPERHEQDNPWAQLACAECKSVIELTHNEWPREKTVWFPTQPVAGAQ